MRPSIASSQDTSQVSQSHYYAWIVPLVLITIIALFYISTIRPGHNWGDDFALYVLHAKNIAEGNGYAQTAYIHNPLYADIGPKSYPPILPIVLAPIYKWFGFDVTVMKIVVGIFFFAALWVLYWNYCAQLPWSYAAGLVLLLGLNPLFWDFKDEILSDFPFLFFVWVTLYCLQHHYDNTGKGRSSLGSPYAVLIGVCMYLAYGTRAIGIVVPAALILYELIRFKKLSGFALTVLLVVASLVTFQAMLLSDAGGAYLSFWKEIKTRDIVNLLLGNIVTYLKALSAYWDNGHSKLGKVTVFLVVSFIATLGLRKRIKDGLTIQEIFLLIYLVVLTPFPFSADRYLYPIVPLYFFYACLGARELRTAINGGGWQYAPIVVAAVIVFSYSLKYATLDYGPIQEGIEKEQSKELFRHLTANSQPSDVLIFRKPRALALLTGRQTTIYPMPSHNGSSDETAWNYFRDVDARYLVVSATAWAGNPVGAEDIKWERQFIEKCQAQCQKVFSNPDFQVFKLKFALQAESFPRLQ